MKKLLFVLLALVIAAPAMAVVTITGTSPANYQLTIGYNSTAETQLVRGFALNIAVDGGAKITAISGYKTGVSTAASLGYGIFPGTIDINSTSGIVNSYATPAAKAGSAGALAGLGSSGLTVELGSLYKGDPNKPATIGNLLTITVDKACNATITTEATRGGVILEDATATTITGGPFAIPGAPATATLSGTITLGVVSPAEVGKVVTIQIVSGSTLLETVSATLGSGGVYSGVITGRAPGTYDIYVKASHWLKKKVAGAVLVAGTANTVSATLTNGDINNDNVVDFSDFSSLRSNYLKTGVGLSGDLNEDGVVDFTDFSSLRTNYLKAGDSF